MHYLKNKHIKGVINYSLTFHMISLLCLCFFIASSFILSNLHYNFVKNILTQSLLTYEVITKEHAAVLLQV